MPARFPLMLQEYPVRNIEELREHFDMKETMEYYFNGKLAKWLEQRLYQKEFIEIEALDKGAADNSAALCRILGVDAKYADEIQFKDVEHVSTKRSLVKQYTDDEEIYKRNIDNCVTSQEELDSLLNKANGQNITVYLIGGKVTFYVPDKCKNVSYIGINNPCISLAPANKWFSNSNINFTNVDILNKEVLHKPTVLSSGDIAYEEDDWVYYCRLELTGGLDSPLSIAAYRARIDGNGRERILDEERKNEVIRRLSGDIYQGDLVYTYVGRGIYTYVGRGICRYKIGEENQKSLVVENTKSCFNIFGEYIYYTRIKKERNNDYYFVYKAKIEDGKSEEVVAKLYEYDYDLMFGNTGGFCVYSDSVYYKYKGSIFRKRMNCDDFDRIVEEEDVVNAFGFLLDLGITGFSIINDKLFVKYREDGIDRSIKVYSLDGDYLYDFHDA